jgi:hypothetical protein
MLWQMLHHFDIHLHMAYLTIALPQERDQVIMEIFLTADLGPHLLRSLGRCRVAHEAIFLSDLTTADGKYLEICICTRKQGKGINVQVSM